MWEKLKIFFGFQETEEQSDKREVHDLTPSPVIKSFKGALINGSTASKFTSSEIKVEEPKIYEDSLNIATYLRENKPVIVNLKQLDMQTGKRLIDFVCGTAYAINGHMMKIGENIFLFTPENILIVDSEETNSFEKGLKQEESHVFLQDAVG